MIRKENLIMTFAGGEQLFRDPNFWVYINSFKKLQNKNADLVILTNDIPEDVKDKLFDMEIEVVEVVPGDVHYIYRDRHLCFWEYLNDHGHKYKYVLVTDCRDVVFQDNPFEWADKWKARHDGIKGDKKFLDHFVILTAEGHKTAQSGFACIEHFEFERDVPRPFLKENKDKYVVNGGTFLGTPLAMQNWHFLVWMTQMKTIGKCTDQASVNWLMYYLEEDATYSISMPQHDNLCLTGEGVKEGAVEPILKDRALYNSKGEKYCFIHQWDRLEGLREEVLAQYGN